MLSSITTTTIICLGLLSATRGQFSPLTVQNPLDYVDGVVHHIQSAQENVRGVNFPDISDYKTKLFHADEGALQSAVGNESQCLNSVVLMGQDLVQLKSYAWKMLDAWGKFPSGVAKGNLQWYGRYYECLETHAHDFGGKWCQLIIGSPNNAAFGIGMSTSMSLGSCVPDTCSDDEVSGLIQVISSATKLPTSAYCPKQPRKYAAKDIIALIICCTLGFFIVAGSVYDYHLANRKYKDYDELLFDAGEVSRIENSNPSVFSQLFLSFSVIKNTKAIFDTTQKEGNINVLHGLRFISMTWVILGHSYIFIVQYIDNVTDYASYFVNHGSFQAIGNATFSVDTFFFLSGLLATYLGMREIARRNGNINIGLAYLYRYLRLTPAYALCILLSVTLYGKMGDGPMWPAVPQTFSMSCQKYWWTNLLYINNIHPGPMGDECFAWGWYLANDMQFFLLSPFLLYILFRYPRIGLSLLAFGTVVSMISTGVVSAHYKEQPQSVGIGLLCSYLMGMFKSNATVGIEAYMDNATTAQPTTSLPPTPQPTPPGPSESYLFWSDIYAKPWCRMGAYFVGAAAGYLLHATKCRVHVNKIFAAVMWVITILTALLIIYGLNGSISNHEALSVNVAALYNAVSRQLWCACLAWLVIACSSGYGGPINAFLSWKPFIPLSRLTYCAYLVHPMVIFWMYATQEVLLHFSVPSVSLYFLGFVAISYAVAFVLSLIIEMPVIGMLKILVKGDKMKPKQPEMRPLINGETEDIKYGTNA